jgi:hypothetical protein
MKHYTRTPTLFLFISVLVGQPTFTEHAITTSADGAYSVYAADVDGDGDMDIIAGSRLDDTVSWYENDGAADPSWTARDIDTSGDWVRDVHIGDLDGDGDLDIVVASRNDDTIAWYENTCDGSDPLVLDLDGDGIELLGLAAGITFDVNADGVLETTGWVGPDDGLLAMDLDGSGQIEDMSEVFSEVFNGGNYTDSLAALATLDTNSDQVISAEDDQFDEILVWQDGDSDGVSTEAELATLTDHGISALDLDVTASDETVSGNTIDAVGTVEFDDATTGTFAEVTFVSAMATSIAAQTESLAAGSTTKNSGSVASTTASVPLLIIPPRVNVVGAPSRTKVTSAKVPVVASSNSTVPTASMVLPDTVSSLAVTSRSRALMP